jgi:Skp family chaperone for outer membrane proteins
MTRFRRVAWVAAAAMLLLAVGSACFAADVAIGTVDIAKVKKEAPRIQQFTRRLDQLAAELDLRLNTRTQNDLLTDEEIKELIDLKLKASPSDKEKARIKELADLSRGRDEELKKLQSVAQPTEEQKKRLAELTDMQKKNKALSDQMAKDYASQYQSEGISLSNKADSELREVVKKIAEKKKLAFVLDKDTVFYGGVDITSDVITGLSRKSDL